MCGMCEGIEELRPLLLVPLAFKTHHCADSKSLFVFNIMGDEDWLSPCWHIMPCHICLVEVAVGLHYIDPDMAQVSMNHRPHAGLSVLLGSGD